MNTTQPTIGCEFANTHDIECCGNDEVRRLNGALRTICDAHFYDIVDASLSLW